MAEDKNLDQDYDKAGFGGALSFGKKPALLLIDFAKAYITKDCGLYAGVEDSAESARKLLAAAREAGIMIVYTRVEFTPGGADGGVFYRKVPALKNFDRGSPMAEFVDGLEPKDDEVVITKQYASAFFGTNLASTLAADGVDTLLNQASFPSSYAKPSATEMFDLTNLTCSTFKPNTPRSKAWTMSWGTLRASNHSLFVV